jgi:hypothetical protein
MAGLLFGQAYAAYLDSVQPLLHHPDQNRNLLHNGPRDRRMGVAAARGDHHDRRTLP